MQLVSSVLMWPVAVREVHDSMVDATEHQLTFAAFELKIIRIEIHIINFLT